MGGELRALIAANGRGADGAARATRAQQLKVHVFSLLVSQVEVTLTFALESG